LLSLSLSLALSLLSLSLTHTPFRKLTLILIIKLIFVETKAKIAEKTKEAMLKRKLASALEMGFSSIEEYDEKKVSAKNRGSDRGSDRIRFIIYIYL
jgi:hypothetical protein